MINTTNYGSNYPPMRGMHRHHHMDPSRMAQTLMTGADSNGDGSISKSEFQTMMQNAGQSNPTTINNLFSMLDSNGNGSVSKQEVSDAFTSMIQQMQGQGTPASVQSGQGGSDADGDNDGSTGPDAPANGNGLQQALMNGLMQARASMASAGAGGDSDGDNDGSGNGAGGNAVSANKMDFLIQGLLKEYQMSNQASTSSSTTSSLLSTSA